MVTERKTKRNVQSAAKLSRPSPRTSWFLSFIAASFLSNEPRLKQRYDRKECWRSSSLIFTASKTPVTMSAGQDFERERVRLPPEDDYQSYRRANHSSGLCYSRLIPDIRLVFGPLMPRDRRATFNSPYLRIVAALRLTDAIALNGRMVASLALAVSIIDTVTNAIIGLLARGASLPERDELCLSTGRGYRVPIGFPTTSSKALTIRSIIGVTR